MLRILEIQAARDEVQGGFKRETRVAILRIREISALKCLEMYDRSARHLCRH